MHRAGERPLEPKSVLCGKAYFRGTAIGTDVDKGEYTTKISACKVFFEKTCKNLMSSNYHWLLLYFLLQVSKQIGIEKFGDGNIQAVAYLFQHQNTDILTFFVQNAVDGRGRKPRFVRESVEFDLVLLAQLANAQNDRFFYAHKITPYG